MTHANVEIARGGSRPVPEGWQPHIVAMVCNWCSYAGADMAGTTRLEYPANVRMVRFPCTGRMSPLMILRAFEQGADGVLVSGCHPGDCQLGTSVSPFRYRSPRPGSCRGHYFR